MSHHSDELPNTLSVLIVNPPIYLVNRYIGPSWLAILVITGYLISPTAMAAESPQEELWVPPRTFQALPTLSAQGPAPTLRSQINQRRNQKWVKLDRLSDEQLTQQSAQTDRGRTKAGFTRKIPDFQTREQAQIGLHWNSAPDGGLISLASFSSPRAMALRLGLRIYHLPDEAELRFFSDQSSQGDVVMGAEIMDSVRKNLDAGDPEAVARMYWSPVEKGETMGVEIYLPPGIHPEQVDVAIPEITHIFLSPGAGLAPSAVPTLNSNDASIMASGACNVNVICQWPTWQSQSQAVGQMTFNDGGSYYICTGTLLNDTVSSGTPYFLSADHCISTQTVASSLQTRWFYYSTVCNTNTTNPDTRTISGGADLLYHSNLTDTSFMRLRNTPPTGTIFSGWTTSKQAINTYSSGLHNPGGDLQKISNGQVASYWNCTPPSGGTFSCSSSADGNFANITWYSGTVEGGSSGSGIFTDSGHYLFGQLYGGTSNCSNIYGSNYYGRFDKAYTNGNLRQWLASQFTLGVSKLGAGTGTITSNPGGINCGATCSANFIAGSNVTLTATPASGSILANWSGCYSSSGNSCEVIMTATQSVTATFDIQTQTFPLTVTKSGLGSVTSNPAGINCGSTCSASFNSGQAVTLTATPEPNDYFSGWSDLSCSGNPTCTVTMDAAKSINATFLQLPASSSVLTVTTSGMGVVQSSPIGINNCSGTCNAAFTNGTQVTLTPSPVTGYYFAGWSGACSGQGTCNLTLNSNQTATASFVQIPANQQLLTLSVSGAGSVSTIPGGLNCSTTCSYPFPINTAVTLIATPVTGNSFIGWTGEGCTGRSSCLITMNSAKSVAASFQNTYTLIMPAINLLLLGD